MISKTLHAIYNCNTWQRANYTEAPSPLLSLDEKYSNIHIG
ncbi:MAG: hypothetical protein OEW37_07910 [Rhodospirillaceae bacterium]|nr:hypothetical protein [Rhodospirillaceae bacterium]